jgi:hypothetical protein
VSTNPSERIRAKNRALDYLIANYQPLNSKAKKLVDLIPKLSSELHSEAQQASTLSCFTGGSDNRVSRAFRVLKTIAPGRQRLIAQCIFDLYLTVYFSEAYEFCGDKEIASLLTDAMLFQATGSEAGSPTEDQILNEGTHTVRGIEKFKSAARMGFKEESQVFGKEIATLQGHRGEIGTIVSVAPISVMLRVHAKWAIRYFIYGTLPTKDEEQKLNELVTKMGKNLREILKPPDSASSK